MRAQATAAPATKGEHDPPSRVAAASHWRCARLWLKVQWDGFRFDPVDYLEGVLWRARGLRVRSRHRLSSLTGRSPSAYDFWVSCREPALRPRLDGSAAAEIVPVVNCRQGSEGLDRTLDSLGGRPAILIGGNGSAGELLVRQPEEIGRNLAGAAWLCPIECGDLLAADALEIYADAVTRNADARIIYADDDLLEDQERRTQPYFKPQWNPELFEHHDFLSGACIVRVDPSGLGAAELEPWPLALIARALAAGPPPVHLPYVLHHRRSRPTPVVPAKPRSPAPVATPLVSIIVPTRNHARLLGTCIAGVQATNYPAIELLIIDNGSDDPDTIAYLDQLAKRGTEVLHLPGPFNYSALNNQAVRRARGDILVFLNNDVEMIDDDWLSLLVMHAVEPDVGAVGAQLLYPDGTVQHAGVYIGIGGGAAHAHRFVGAGEGGYFERARLPQRVSAVTAACLAVDRQKFLEVGGFDEEEFPVAFNDVDLCLKLGAAGWHSIYEPRARLIHHESKSRGSDRAKGNRARFAGELQALKRKWRTDVQRDPFHHPQLSPFSEQFFVSI